MKKFIILLLGLLTIGIHVVFNVPDITCTIILLCMLLVLPPLVKYIWYLEKEKVCYMDNLWDAFLIIQAAWMYIITIKAFRFSEIIENCIALPPFFAALIIVILKAVKIYKDRRHKH